MRRLHVIGTVAAGGLVLVGVGIGDTQAATTPTPHIGISTVQYDSPGGTVPAIVTLYNPPPGFRTAITATATGGATMTCTGAAWHNPIRHTISRTCYLTLPLQPGSYTINGTAILTKETITHRLTGSGSRPVVADGKPSPTPMTLAEIHTIEHCQNTTDEVWLTFDDGGSTTQVDTILATLERNKIKAHFFFRGDWARTNPTLFTKIKTAGHIIGNHTDTHPALSRMSSADVAKQIDGGTAATGTPKLLRPPFGAGAFTTRLADIATSKNYKICRWTTDTYDWDKPSTDQVVERITYGDYRSAPITAGGVILMHGHGQNTSTGLQQIINAIRAKKLKLQPLK